MLGGAAANLAVTLGAFGGIFIGGGIVPRMAEWFATSPFRARFEAKGRFTDYLAQIPTYVIMTPNPAFYGVATILSEHLRGRSGANTLMERVQHLQHELSPAEQRVATLVLEHPRKVLGEPIAEIARLADVSQPTVIRFCRSLGFLGLADFKLKFASSLTGTIPVRHSQVRVSDSTHDLSAKVIDNTVSAILKFRDQLDVASIDRAIAAAAQGEPRRVLRDGQFARGGAGRPAQVLPLPHSDVVVWRLAPVHAGRGTAQAGRRGDRDLDRRANCRSCWRRSMPRARPAPTSSPSPAANRRWRRRPPSAWRSITARTAPPSCR